MRKLIFILILTFTALNLYSENSYIIIKGKPHSYKDFLKKVIKVNKLPSCCKYRIIKNHFHKFKFINKFSRNLSDPLESQQTWLVQINAEGIYSISTGKGILIGILDSGVELDHEDLKGQIVDYFNVADNNTDVTDYLGHGTAVVGIMAAIPNNGKGIIGIAPDAKYIVVKIAHGNSSTFDDYSVAEGIYYLVDKGCKVINMSIEMGSESEIVDDAIDYAKSKGVILIASSGNTYGVHESFPASNSYVLGVSSVDENGDIAYFAGYDNQTFIFAPGERVLTTYKGDAYVTETGTSFSAPMVTGIIADILSLNPYLNLADIKKIILYSSNKNVNEYPEFKILNGKESLLNTGIRFFFTKSKYLSTYIQFSPTGERADLYIGATIPGDYFIMLGNYNDNFYWYFSDKTVPTFKNVFIIDFKDMCLFGNDGIFPSININELTKGRYCFYGGYKIKDRWVGYIKPYCFNIQ